MSEIRFERSVSSVKILNPLRDFGEDIQSLELRKDPLLGHTSVYNPFLKEKVKFFFGENDPELVKKLTDDSAKKCFFCSHSIEKSTPQYPPELLPEGRLRVGEAVLFPNLYPIGKYHSVIVLSNAHFLRLSEFAPEIIGNGFRAAQKFVNLVYDRDPSPLFVAVNANYLFPAGATLVHPHLQMLITSAPYSFHERLIDTCSSYHQSNGSCYFLDLTKKEMEIDLRYIAGKGGWHWLAAFAPSGNNEIIAVHEERSDFGLLSSEDLKNLASGISKVLLFYEDLGHLSFNYTILSVRDPAYKESSRCMLKIISRQNLYPNYRNDDYFLQKLLHSEVIINLPEELAAKLKGYFKP